MNGIIVYGLYSLMESDLFRALRHFGIAARGGTCGRITALRANHRARSETQAEVFPAVRINMWHPFWAIFCVPYDIA